MNRTSIAILIALIAIAVVFMTVRALYNTGPRYDPTRPVATPTPGLSQ